MTKVYVITEGPLDAAVLRHILPKDLSSSTEFVVASNRYSMQSLARSILATRRLPVAVVLDADTEDDRRIREDEEFLTEALGQASVGAKFGIFIAKPDLTSILARHLPISKKMDIKTSKFPMPKVRPPQHLSKLKTDADAASLGDLLGKLDRRTLTDVRREPFFGEVIKFLTSVVGTGNHRPKVA
jgi:hypothetical protein